MDTKKTKDVSEQKSLNKFQNFLETVPDAITIINKQGTVQSINSQTENLFGYKKEEIIGKNVAILMATRFKETYFGNLERFFNAYKMRKIGEGLELLARHKDGSEFPIEISLSKLETKKEMLVCASIRNISIQKNIEKELIEAKESAEAAKEAAENEKNKAKNALKSKQQFLSNMSHEIRTPMNSIVGFTKVLLKTDLTENQTKYLNATKISCDTMIVLINDILDLAKVDAGTMIFEQIPFKLSASITKMMHLFEAKIKEKNLHLILNYDSNIPEVLVGDPIRLHQIILNLVSNAVKFTSEGKIVITIQKSMEDLDNVVIDFSVSDTGIGIEADKIDLIFENFQQAYLQTSRIFGGTGLGLAIVKQLVETQGGVIQVKSEIDKGTLFSFNLKFKKAKEHDYLESEIKEIMSTEIEDVNILVVEDVELNQLLMETLLDDFGFKCTIVANGKLAIEELLKNDYDMVLMDLHMPVMNGFQTTNHIRNSMKSKIPIVALTADVTTVDLKKCQEVGMNDYISKPINEQLLYNKIISILKKHAEMSDQEKTESLDIDKLKCVNLDYLKRITKSNPQLMSDMIRVYLKQTPPIIKTIQKSLHKKDWQTLKSAIHKLLPSFSIMGMDEEVELMAKKVQENAHTLEITDEVHHLTLELIKVCHQSFAELEIELNNLIKNP
jgi:PAS domain S-box-containing protein